MAKGRFKVLLKIIGKLLILFLGMLLSIGTVGMRERIYMPADNFFQLVYKTITYFPFSDALKAFWENYTKYGFYNGISIIYLFLTMIPVLPLMWVVLRWGFGDMFEYLLGNLSVDYVYKASGEYAYTGIDYTTVFMFIAILVLKIGIASMIAMGYMFILPFTVVWNIIQLFWVKIGR